MPAFLAVLALFAMIAVAKAETNTGPMVGKSKLVQQLQVAEAIRIFLRNNPHKKFVVMTMSNVDWNTPMDQFNVASMRIDMPASFDTWAEGKAYATTMAPTWKMQNVMGVLMDTINIRL